MIIRLKISHSIPAHFLLSATTTLTLSSDPHAMAVLASIFAQYAGVFRALSSLTVAVRSF